MPQVNPDRTQLLGPRYVFSPYFEATEQAGAFQYVPYNRVHWPVNYGNDPDEQYSAVTERVGLMDVACERPVEIRGPDAQSFTDYLCTRDLSTIGADQARHTAVCEPDGTLYCEAMVLKLEDDVMWVFNGPSDFDIWARAIAAHTDYDITEILVTRVAPIGLQGPRSYDIMKAVAPAAADMRFFRWVRVPIAGVDTVVVRSGWSGEYGFELCPVNASEAMGVWNALVDEGEQHGLMITSMTGPRYERGVTDTTHGWNLGLNPYEARLGRVVNLNAGPFVGKEALQRIHDEGPSRKSVGLFLDVESLPRMEANWPVTSEGRSAGVLLDYTYSRMFGRHIARALVDASIEVGQTITIHHPDGEASAEVTTIPFPDSGTAKA